MTASDSWLTRGPDRHQWVGTTVSYRERRDRGRALRRCVLGVLVFAAGGTAVASWLLPPARTADNAARAFVEARFEGDPATAWNLLCRPERARFADYRTFAGESDKRRQLPDVDVATESVRGALIGNRGAAVVTVSATMPDGWIVYAAVIHEDVTVIVEDGAFRVCGINGRDFGA